MIVPAVFLGGLAVWAVVYFVTVAIRCGIEDLRCRRDPGRQRYETDDDLDPVGLVLGILAVAFLVVSFFIIPKEWVSVLWTVLTIIGILAGISTFFLFGTQAEPTAGRRYGRSTSTSGSSRPAHNPGPTVSTRALPSVQEDPYRELLSRVRYDRGVADRLVEYERKRTPNESFDELCRSAVQRWQRDNR